MFAYVGYAHPTSKIAKILGKYDDGTYFTCTIPHEGSYRKKNHAAHATYADALHAAHVSGLPLSKWSVSPPR